MRRAVARGEESGFDDEHGFYVEAISKDTVKLPQGWENRLVKFTADLPEQSYGVTGFCLDPNDLCVTKPLARRDHDRVFIAELITAGLVDPVVILERLQGLILWPDNYTEDEDKALAVYRTCFTKLQVP